MKHAVVLVILGLQTQRVGLDAQVDVLGDENRRIFRLRLLDAGGEREDAVVHAVAVQDVAVAVGMAVAVFLERDFQLAAVGQFHALAQTAVAAKTVEHPRNRARVLAEFGGFALEAVNLLDDFDGDQDIIVREVEEGVGVVKDNIGVEDVIFHWVINFSKQIKVRLQDGDVWVTNRFHFRCFILMRAMRWCHCCICLWRAGSL